MTLVSAVAATVVADEEFSVDPEHAGGTLVVPILKHLIKAATPHSRYVFSTARLQAVTFTSSPLQFTTFLLVETKEPSTWTF